MLTMNYQNLLESGVAQWNQWRSQHPHKMPDLRGINLTHSYLFEINLMGSDLRGVDLRRACLIGANLSQANLSGANLGGAYLSEANLRNANLRNANLIDTQMANVDLSQANLVGTCLEQVKQTLSQVSQAYPTQAPNFTTPDSLEPKTLLPPTAVQHLSQAPRFSEQTQVAYKQANATGSKANTADSKVWTANAETTQGWAAKVWSPDIIKRCQHKLCDYYIGPMATLILNEIITHQRPQTLTQFIALVADRLPDPQDALRFKNSFSHAASNHTHSPTPSPQKRLQDKPPQKPQVQPSKGHQASPKASLPQHRPPALSPTCIAKCRQQLSEYYIAPMAQMLIDDVLALHQPTSNHRFVQLVADHLPPEEVENFSRQVLS
ncbi:MAG: pentapeptide repeat-containing protein [Cyanobacteria bacterium J06649_5]